MRYIVKQKIFSLGDNFSIKNESGEDIFLVKSQLLSFGRKLRIYDLNGNELCYIEQQLFRFMPEYNIYIAGQFIANVKKKFAFFRNNFEITGEGVRYEVEGDFLAHEFIIRKNETVIARISKKFFAFSDTYGVEVDDSQDQITPLALSIVIDMVYHERD